VSRSVEVNAPNPEHFRYFNDYCRAMDEWMRERWAALDAELRQIDREHNKVKP